jgi:four helix bundle protein
MNIQTKRPGAHTFVALEVALQVVAEARGPVMVIRRADTELAQQIVRAASSVVANIAEGNGRFGKDRVRFFRIAAGSAEETRAHLRVALAWGWVEPDRINTVLVSIDRVVALLWRLTH